MNNTDDHLRYPIGKFKPTDSYSWDECLGNIQVIETLPLRLESLTQQFDNEHLNSAYRPGGWTARQVIHHLADSHMHAYIRTKWTLTEPNPVIKAYDEVEWAKTPEVSLDPVISINVLKALHMKWTALLRSVPYADFSRFFIHPETKKEVSLQRLCALYAWHGEHHLGHLKIIAAKA